MGRNRPFSSSGNPDLPAKRAHPCAGPRLRIETRGGRDYPRPSVPGRHIALVRHAPV